MVAEEEERRLDRLVPEGLGSPLWVLCYLPPTVSALMDRLEIAAATVAFFLGLLLDNNPLLLLSFSSSSSFPFKFMYLFRERSQKAGEKLRWG